MEQTVIVQVFGFVYPANSDIRLTGGEEAYYRLQLAKAAPAVGSPGLADETDQGDVVHSKLSEKMRSP